MNHTVYVFPDESISSVLNGNNALMKFRIKITNGKLFWSFPEAKLSFKERQDFNCYHYNVILTNDPFIIACYDKKAVVICRVKDGVIIETQPDFQTFGASYDYLLMKLFGFEILIPTVAIEKMKKIIKSTSVKKIREALYGIGESFEKRFLYERIAVLDKKKKRKK